MAFLVTILYCYDTQWSFLRLKYVVLLIIWSFCSFIVITTTIIGVCLRILLFFDKLL